MQSESYTASEISLLKFSKKYIKIENKIKADRDRNSFSSALTNTFLSIWARSGFYYNGMKNNKAIKFILEKSRSQWPKGLPILSALANWEAKNEDKRMDDHNLYVSEVKVDSGRMLKRVQPAPQGRAHRIRKRSNHVTLVVDSKIVKTEVK